MIQCLKTGFLIFTICVIAYISASVKSIFIKPHTQLYLDTYTCWISFVYISQQVAFLRRCFLQFLWQLYLSTKGKEFNQASYSISPISVIAYISTSVKWIFIKPYTQLYIATYMCWLCFVYISQQVAFLCRSFIQFISYLYICINGMQFYQTSHSIRPIFVIAYISLSVKWIFIKPYTQLYLANYMC